ncbi:hypothetical protein B0H10DRAFT_1950074 [Mycena sp. CBHHK59/15]|nr:hypothetical protein B0H10DRAFT_1950074 [Mycena sp. CBHHK59/15]
MTTRCSSRYPALIFLALVIRRTSPLLRFFFRCGRRGFAVPTRSNKAPSLVTIPETFSSQVPCADPWIQTSIFGLPANHLMNMHKIRPRAPIKHSHGITPHTEGPYLQVAGPRFLAFQQAASREYMINIVLHTQF